jgi:methylmalonyl-CoA mutase C-terminal domain/subunit
MAADRIVVGAIADDSRARSAARTLRDAGHEVVFVGGGQTTEQLARTAVAEDAVRIVVDADAGALRGLLEACAALDAADIAVEPVV